MIPRVEIERSSSLGTTVRVALERLGSHRVRVVNYRRLKGERWYKQKQEIGVEMLIAKLGLEGVETWDELTAFDISD